MTDETHDNVNLYKKTNRVLSRLLSVATLPSSLSSQDFTQESVVKEIFNKVKEELTETDLENITNFYNFIKTTCNVTTFSHINHLDAFLRFTKIKDFFVNGICLQEAWILFVDTESRVEQLWLKDRANSIVFPEAERCINCQRIQALGDNNQLKSAEEKTHLNFNCKKTPSDCHLADDNVLSTDDLKTLHSYREHFARYLVELNNKKAKTATQPFSLKAIPAFSFLGSDNLLATRRPIEKDNFILLSTAKEFIDKQPLIAKNNEFPFDNFIIDAMFANKTGSTNLDTRNHIFFSTPLDPVDLVEVKGHHREHGAIWSGFLKVPNDELDWLDSEDSLKDENIPELLLWRISTLKIALNILGQPCLRKQLEKEIRKRTENVHTKESHDKLLLLQRPLDALTKAFRSVQAEAQEMESILNNPETVLFNTHKLLSDLFIVNKEIKISQSLTIRCNHHWASSTTKEQMRLAYAYAICRIFGHEKELITCQTIDAVEATTQHILLNAHREGAHQKLIKLICQLFLADKEINDRTIFRLIDSLTDTHANIKGIILEFFLKPIIFTPFKSFGLEWPRMAFNVAFDGDNFINRRDVLTVDTDVREYDNEVLVNLTSLITPFPQHAILGFIINFKTKNKDGWSKIEFNDGNATDISISMMYSGEKKYDPSKKSGETENHFVLNEYIRHAVRYKTEQIISGDFLNIFGMLIRNGLNLVVDKPKSNDWHVLTPKDPNEEMLIVGKVKEVSDDGCVSSYQRHFSITQQHDNTEGNGIIKIRWYDDTQAVKITSPVTNTRSNIVGQGTTTIVEKTETVIIESAINCENIIKANDTQLLNVALLDHKEKHGSTFRFELNDNDAFNGIYKFVESNDGSIPYAANVLFLHWDANTNIETIISSFLRDRNDRYIILISSTGDPHPDMRDCWNLEHSGKVLHLLNPNCWSLNKPAIVAKIKKMLKVRCL